MMLVVFALLFAPTAYITIVLITLAFTVVTALRARFSHRPWSSYQTALFSGHVSHVRFQPKVHSFSYPIFFFLIDLSESYALFQQSYSALWPLNKLMQLNDCDHLKNGEGLCTDKSNDNSLAARIQRLVAERTVGKYIVNSTQPILLLTHLSYFGYCFNPVSFYYILKSKEDPTIEAIVAEVSNTPWLEMKCYVLHPDSTDISQEGSCKRETKALNYLFPKQFHVSPFMDMEHMYDWTFSDQPKQSITVSTSMKKAPSGVQYFNAFLSLRRKSLNPITVGIKLLCLPFFCVIIQIWIHFEAARLMLKGIAFIPHPEGATTRASRIIEMVVRPIVFLYDKYHSIKNKNK
jgi:DUF1365 family protein